MKTSTFAALATLPFLAACGARVAPESGGGALDVSPLTCGPGTEQVGDQCVAVSDCGAALDATPPDSDADASSDAGSDVASDAGSDAAGDSGAGDAAPPGPPDAATASGFAVDPAHDNCVDDAVIASPLVAAWTAELDGPASYPLVVDDRIIIASSGPQGTVRALDRSTGALVWGPLALGQDPLLAAEGGAFFALDGGGRLSAYDTATGSSRWSTQLQGQWDFASPPVASNGLVFVDGLGSGGTTFAIDGATGATAWTANTFDGSDGSVAVSNGVVYEAEACDQVSAFDALGGHRAWLHSTSCTGGGGAAPAVHQGLVWVRDWALGNIILDTAGQVRGSFQASAPPSFHAGTAFYLNGSTLAAVEIATQRKVWSFNGDNQLCTSAVVAGAGGQVFVGSRSGKVFELDEATGAQVSVSDAGAAVTCASEIHAVGLGRNRLLVPAGNTLVAY